jgi:hypothetical protein
MNIAENNPTIQTGNKRSPFSLNFPEIVFATVVALATWLGFRWFLQSILPFPCGSFANNIPLDCGWTKEQAWQALGLPLFSKYAMLLVLINALAGIFLVRVIRRDIRDFSPMSSLALAWPLLSTLGIHLLAYFGMCVLPVGFVLSLIATIISVEEKRYQLDWTSLPISFASMVISGMYFSELLSLYGD